MRRWRRWAGSTVIRALLWLWFVDTTEATRIAISFPVTVVLDAQGMRRRTFAQAVSTMQLHDVPGGRSLEGPATCLQVQYARACCRKEAHRK